MKEQMNLKDNPRAKNAGRMMAFALSTLMLTSSCQQQQIAKTNQTPTTNQQVASQPVTVKPPSQELKTYQGVGVVTKVVLENPYDKTLASVELDHEEIAGLMPPMIMEFYVKEKSLLKNIKVGDKVDFTVEAKGGTEIISEIKKK
jgi:Cu/Ag efflux protein CusF